MLTEDQLASLLSAVTGYERLILVGDSRQLPPIGVGRPFVDLIDLLRPDQFDPPQFRISKGYAELTVRMRQAYTKTVYVDRAFQKKTNELVQKHVGAVMEGVPDGFVKIDGKTLDVIKQQTGGKATKVINLIKSIEKTAEDESDDPFLVALSDRAKAVQESFESRQTSTEDALQKLLDAVDDNEKRKAEQAARGLDNLTYFILCKLTDEGIANAERVSKNIAGAFAQYPNWKSSEGALRELRKKVTFAIYAEEDDLDKVTATVESLFNLLNRAFKKS